eukprot:TRINITY_DN8658_c0_g1_i1.p1 TRINITY_DN8658_c0_g1~~TRINITY_DN8658_c0_g1_i1.p1  ORF type:complete len:562 (+),score=125.43 TRINITY_DN8658_c0_g1_i1:2-1687(+)
MADSTAAPASAPAPGTATATAPAVAAAPEPAPAAAPSVSWSTSDAPPAASGAEGAPSEFKQLTEGQATILYREGEVFYNPLQEFNRDLSILTISMFQQMREEEAVEEMKKIPRKRKVDFVPGEGIKIFEALAATGLRSIRYHNEIPGKKEIMVNDLEPAAVESIQRNIEYNQLDQTKIKANEGDCNRVLWGLPNHFDVVDLDPYGSASPFLNSALANIRNGGLLCVTCTDLQILCGGHPDQCYQLYGSVSLKGAHCHEFALRQLLGIMDRSASLIRRTITPLASVFVDFYVRVFVRVFDDRAGCVEVAKRSLQVYQCGSCFSRVTTPLAVDKVSLKGNSSFKMSNVCPPNSERCEFCQCKMRFGGPIYGGKLHDDNFLTKAIARLNEPEAKVNFRTQKRLLGLLSLMREELPVPLFYSIPLLFRTVKLQAIKYDIFKSALVNAGYQVSVSHCKPDAVKTDAPMSFIWDILRTCHQQTPANLEKHGMESIVGKLLSVPPTATVDFTFNRKAVSAAGKLPRFIKHPGMGPLTRAKGKKPEVWKRPLEDPKEREDAAKKPRTTE